jgi:flagellar basal body-associated protein FliL
MKFVMVIVILTIALTVVWSAVVWSGDNQDEDAGDNQDEDDDQDHSIWPTHEFIVNKTKWKSGRLLRCMVAWLRYSCITNVALLLCCKVV